MKNRKSVGDEDVLNHVIPKQEPKRNLNLGNIKPRFFRIQVNQSIADKVRNIAVHERVTLTELLSNAISEMVQRLEEKRGAPYPFRSREMSPGRPIQA